MYYHICIQYNDKKEEDQSLKNIEDLEYIKDYLIFPFLREKDVFNFNGKNIVRSKIKDIRIYVSEQSLEQITQKAMARYPNIIGWSGFCYDEAEEITNKIFPDCHKKIKKEKNIKKIIMIIVWILAVLLMFYCLSCLFQEKYNLFNYMNMEGKAFKIGGAIVYIVSPLLIQKILDKVFG